MQHSDPRQKVQANKEKTIEVICSKFDPFRRWLWFEIITVPKLGRHSNHPRYLSIYRSIYLSIDLSIYQSISAYGLAPHAQFNHHIHHQNICYLGTPMFRDIRLYNIQCIYLFICRRDVHIYIIYIHT